MECQVDNCTSTELVYSGTAALLLGGIPTEKYCYAHANEYARIDIIARSEKEDTTLTPEQQAWIDSGPITVEALKLWLSLTNTRKE